MTERLPEPDFYTSPHEIVGHDIISRWIADGITYTRVEFADGSVEEFEIPTAVHTEGALLSTTFKEIEGAA